MISATRAGESSLDIVMKFNTPFGNPAYMDSWSTRSLMNRAVMLTSSKILITSAWLRGHSSELLITRVFPHIIGGPSARTVRLNGAFHGAIPSLDPDPRNQ